MTGYSEPATVEAQQHARDRAVILLDGAHVRSLTAGSVRAADLVDERIDAIVRRYD